MSINRWQFHFSLIVEGNLHRKADDQSCDICSKKFSLKSLKRHMLTHTGEKRKDFFNQIFMWPLTDNVDQLIPLTKMICLSIFCSTQMHLLWPRISPIEWPEQASAQPCRRENLPMRSVPQSVSPANRTEKAFIRTLSEWKPNEHGYCLDLILFRINCATMRIVRRNK